jgi:hypothetical protein
MVKNFRYEQEGALALSGVPETPAAVDWLHDQGIRAVVSLHPISPEVEARLRERGIAWHPLLIGDFAAGVPAEIGEVFEAVRRHAEEEPAALIH